MSAIDTLAELEQRVSSLEAMLGAGAGGGDSLQPNPLTVNPDGTTSQNVDLPESPNSNFAPGSAIAWQSGGVTRSYIEGVAGSPAGHFLYAQAGPSTGAAALELVDTAAGPGGDAALQISAAPNMSAANSIRLLAGDGSSNFVRRFGAPLPWVVDDNAGAFYKINFSPALPAGATANASFNTLKPSWTVVLAIGALQQAGGTPYWTWEFVFVAPNQIFIGVANPLSTAQGPGTWVGFVVGY